MESLLQGKGASSRKPALSSPVEALLPSDPGGLSAVSPLPPFCEGWALTRGPAVGAHGGPALCVLRKLSGDRTGVKASGEWRAQVSPVPENGRWGSAAEAGLGLPWTGVPSLTGRVQGPSGDWGLGVRGLCPTQALPTRFHAANRKELSPAPRRKW